MYCFAHIITYYVSYVHNSSYFIANNMHDRRPTIADMSFPRQYVYILNVLKCYYDLKMEI